MPSEVRTIAFDQDEVVEALTRYRARKGKPIPHGKIYKFVVEQSPKIRVALAIAVNGEDRLESVQFNSEEVGAALVMHCIKSKVPLPARGAQKALQVVGGNVCLVVSIGTVSEALSEHVKTD